MAASRLRAQFTQLPDDAPGRQQRSALGRRLWQLANQKEGGVSVVLTVRSDFIGRCGELVLDDQGQRLDQILYQPGHRIAIAQLGPEQLRDAIVEPAHRVGLELEAGLAERMLSDVAAEPGALPLLADTMDALWLRRQGPALTQSAYDELGGVTGTLTGRADQLLAGGTADEQRAARRLLVQLCNIDEETGQRTRRRVKVAQVRPAGAAGASFDSMLSQLVAARLLVRGKADGQSDDTLEIAHEALLRRWSRLGQWLQEDQQRLRQMQRLVGWEREAAEHGTLLRGHQLGCALEAAQELGEELPAAVRRLIDHSEAELRLEEEHAKLARDSQRMLAIANLSADPTRAATLLREMESPHLATGDTQGNLRVFPVDGQRAPRVWNGHCGVVSAICFAPDGHSLATASLDGSIGLWDRRVPGEGRRLAGHRQGVLSLAFRHDGHELVSGGQDRTAIMWDVARSALDRAVPLVPEQPLPPNFWARHRPVAGGAATNLPSARSGDGKRIAAAEADGNVTVREAGTLCGTLGMTGPPVTVLGLSPDGSRLAVGRTNGEVHIYDLDFTGEQGPAPQLLRHDGMANLAVFSPDGQRVVTADEKNCLWLWDRDGAKRALIDEGRAESCVGLAHNLEAFITTDALDRLFYWPLDLDSKSLIERLWRATPFCLPVGERQLLLRESPALAERNNRRAKERVAAAAATARPAPAPIPSQLATSPDPGWDNPADFVVPKVSLAPI